MVLSISEILNGKDYIEYEELFNNPEILMLEDSDIYDRVSIVAEEDEDEII